MKKTPFHPRVSALIGAFIALSCGDDSRVIGKKTSGESGSGGLPAAGVGGTTTAGRGGTTPGSGGTASGSGGASGQGGDAGAVETGGTGATPSGGSSGTAGSGSPGAGGSDGGSSVGGSGGAGLVPGGGAAGASNGGNAGVSGGGQAGASGSCDNGCVRDTPTTGCAASESSWTCSGNHDMALFLESCESQPVGSIRYCCPANFLSQCPDCPADGAACTFGRCCSGLSCCGGQPIPVGSEYCAAQCPQ